MHCRALNPYSTFLVSQHHNIIDSMQRYCVVCSRYWQHLHKYWEFINTNDFRQHWNFFGDDPSIKIMNISDPTKYQHPPAPMGKRGTPSYGKQKTKSKNRINDGFEQESVICMFSNMYGIYHHKHPSCAGLWSTTTLSWAYKCLDTIKDRISCFKPWEVKYSTTMQGSLAHWEIEHSKELWAFKFDVGLQYTYLLGALQLSAVYMTTEKSPHVQMQSRYLQTCLTNLKLSWLWLKSLCDRLDLTEDCIRPINIET